MKNYIKSQINVTRFDTEDVMTTSGTGSYYGVYSLSNWNNQNDDITIDASNGNVDLISASAGQ